MKQLSQPKPKLTQILDYLNKSQDPSITEFIRTGSHGKLTFHFVDKRLIRIELDMTHIPDQS